MEEIKFATQEEKDSAISVQETAVLEASQKLEALKNAEVTAE